MQRSKNLPKLFRPEVYQGKKHPRNYFEGWYFKLVSKGGAHIWSVIPGVSYSEDPHSFVQVIHANSGKTWYCRYNLEEFSASSKELLIRVGPNRFSGEGIELDIHQEDLEIQGTISFHELTPFPVSLKSPGIMGWYSYAPFMECYHGVVSMQHTLSGSLNLRGDRVVFDGGKGYSEKDWGRSMPSDWIWIQSNHFTNDETASLMISLARIPWMRSFFPGFLSFLNVNGKLYRFATYNGSRVKNLVVTAEQVLLVLENKKQRLKVEVSRNDGGILKAPRHGNMDRDIQESIVSVVNIELTTRAGEPLFSGKGLYAGLEIVGDVASYFRNN